MDTVDRDLGIPDSIGSDFTVNREERAPDASSNPFPISVGVPGCVPQMSIAEDPTIDRAILLKELGDQNPKYLGRRRGADGLHQRRVGAFPTESSGSWNCTPNTRANSRLRSNRRAPSRTHIKRYHDFLAEVDAEAERVNWKFKKRDWRPIVFLKRHHNHSEILPYYRKADVCLVTSLHDGMNLVAKEFVAARSDNAGVLILSPFAGAARELRDALLVNPYDTERMADALRFALEMPPAEQADRMQRMREVVREHNIYRWAGELIEELTRVRLGSENVSIRAL
jgi:glycosyltransferase involved in cell wall biosynthesis